MTVASHFMSTAKAKATSRSAWVLPKPESSFVPEDKWSNADQEPVPRALQTWTVTTFALYWVSDLINAGSWSQVSSFVSLGLTWWESLIAVFMGGVLLSIVIVANGIVGARLHTPFAITSRAAFGYNLSIFAVVSRMVIAWFWLSVNTYQGGTFVRIMIIAIWPSFRDWKMGPGEGLPASSGTNSRDMLCFFIFWALQFPFCLIHPRKLRPLFLLKSISVPIAAVGMMAWSIHAAGDRAGAVMRASPSAKGLDGWFAFMTAVTSCMSTWSTLACNIGDFSRYSKKETAASLQMLFVPMLWTICALFGAICSNMCLAIYGEYLWQPVDVLDKWMGTHVGRAFGFLCAAAWGIGNIGTNVTANSISAATDHATLMPKWINILRGQLFAIIVGVWAFAPWKVLASATSFLSFMASYAIVLAPIAAVLASDFFLVKRGRYDVPALYNPRGRYTYTWGINWRALVALIVSIGPNMPGMIRSLDSSIDIGGARWVYCVATIFGLTVAAGVHWALSTLFPDHESLVSRCILAQDVWDGKFDESDDSAADHRGIVDYSEREKEDGERGDLAPSLEKEKDKAGSDSGVLV